MICITIDNRINNADREGFHQNGEALGKKMLGNN